MTTSERKSPTCHKDDMWTLPYLAWHEEAEKRVKAGRKQERCVTCGLYYFVPKEKRNDHD